MKCEDAVVASRLNFEKIQPHCKAKHLVAQRGETRIYIPKQNGKWMLARLSISESKCWVLTWIHGLKMRKAQSQSQ